MRQVTEIEFLNYIKSQGGKLGGWFNEDCFAYDSNSVIIGRIESAGYHSLDVDYEPTEWPKFYIE